MRSRIRICIGAALRVLFVAGLCAFMLLPLVWAFSSSLKPLDEVYAFPPRFSVSTPQWSNYREALTRLPVLRFLVNALLISGVSTIGTVLTASMAGYALARMRHRPGRFWFGLVLFGMLTPGSALMAPRFLLYDWLGWINTYKPLIVPAWLGGGAFHVFLLRQFFRSMPSACEDAAVLDGATPWQVYRHVMLPRALPALITCGMLGFVYHWQSFLDPLMYLSDFQTFPIALGLRMYQSTAGVWANLLMATAVVALVPVAILFLCAERSMMQGLGVLPGGREAVDSPCAAHPPDRDDVSAVAC